MTDSEGISFSRLMSPIVKIEYDILEIEGETTSMRQHHCDVCNEAFSQQSILVNHKRIHDSKKLQDGLSRSLVSIKREPDETFDDKKEGCPAERSEKKHKYPEAPVDCQLFTIKKELEEVVECDADSPDEQLFGNSLVSAINGASSEFVVEDIMQNVMGEEKLVNKLARFECDICQKRFAKKSNLVDHKNIHSGEKPYECEICHKTFAYKQSYEFHRKNHVNLEMYECERCKKVFKQKQYLKIHMKNCNLKKIKVEKKKEYRCDFCEKTFENYQCLYIHKKIHLNTEQYECGICKKVFKQLMYLKIHMKNIHTIPKKTQNNISGISKKLFECNVCQKTFAKKINLFDHLNVHSGDRPYRCDVCQKTFAYINSLKLHKNIHVDNQEYECHECKKVFKLKHYLTIHIKNVHDQKLTNEKLFECDICQKKFANKKNLIEHKNKHSGERPYGCDVCEKTFPYRESLRVHKRTHDDTLKFECGDCQKVFKHESSLKMHKKQCYTKADEEN